MAEYIEREKVYEMLNALGGSGAEPESWADGWDKAIDTAIEKLSTIPTEKHPFGIKRCTHRWEVIKTIEIYAGGQRPRYIVYLLCCTECGKIKKVRIR